MTKLKLFLIGISIGLIPIKIFAQHWQNIGNGASFKVGRLYADTNLNRLYTGKGLISSGLNAIDYWDGTDWDTLRSIDSPIFAINKFQGNLVLSNNKMYRYFNNNWEMLSSEYILGLYNDENNFLYAVGGFDSIGGVAASNLAKWDGINWSAIDTTKWSGAVSCTIIYNNELYIGGSFVNYNGTIDRVARWDGNQWQPVGNGIRGGMGGVNCFEIYNNELYVGGMFNMVQNPGNAIAKWDGSNWYDVGGGMTSTNAQIFDLQTYNNELYACGVFTKAGGQQINSIAKWNGTDWCGLGFNASNNGWVYSMAVLNNELYIGGAFDVINGDTMNYVSKWIGGNYTNVCGNTTSIQMIDNIEGLTILPNPATETIKILNLSPSSNITITNLTGNIVFQTKINQSPLLDISQLPSGIYFIQYQSNNNIQTTKFIKQ